MVAVEKGAPFPRYAALKRWRLFLCPENEMYLIHLACSCQIELPTGNNAPVFRQSKNCCEEHSKPLAYLNSRISRIQEIPSADAIAEFMDFDERELLGNETWH